MTHEAYELFGPNGFVPVILAWPRIMIWSGNPDRPTTAPRLSVR